jgi:uncharacterized UPF0160 family protein
MTDITLYTHSGPGHADEAFAVAALRILYPKARLVRTRDLALIHLAMGDPNAYFLDIGGNYNPVYNFFDHHQPEGAGYRDPGHYWPFATAGLVWRSYGRKVVQKLQPKLSRHQVRSVAWRIDMALLRYVDAIDCGMDFSMGPPNGPSLSAIIASFNTAWPSTEDCNERFPYMAMLCQALLENFCARFAGKLLAEEPVRHGERIFGGRVLLLGESMPWGDVVVKEMPQVLLVITPARDGSQWQLRCVEERKRKLRMLLPPEWAGLEQSKLAKAAVPGAQFCHRARYLAGADSKDAALAMAELALQWHDGHSEIDASPVQEEEEPQVSQALATSGETALEEVLAA